MRKLSEIISEINSMESMALKLETLSALNRFLGTNFTILNRRVVYSDLGSLHDVLANLECMGL